MSEDRKDNIIQFPGLKKEEKEIVFQADEGFGTGELELKQTMEFVEGCVDDLSIALIKNFVDIGVKIEKPKFYGDLAMVAEMIRVLLYRDFEVSHVGQSLVDKMITINFDDQNQPMPVLNYSKVIDNDDVEKTKAEVLKMSDSEKQLELDLSPGDDDGKNN